MPLKKFIPKSKYPRKSIARELEEGMKQHFEKEKRLKRNKRVKKNQLRYV